MLGLQQEIETEVSAEAQTEAQFYENIIVSKINYNCLNLF